MNLTNAIALITGGMAGIGRAIAKTLAESGARVAITGRDKNRLEEAARTLDLFPIQANVSNEADVIRSYREVLAKFGDLDILVNNAGVGVFKSLVDMDRANFDTVFATNVTGAMLMGREAAKHFIKRNRGAIINIASTAGLRGAANSTAYYASKFALRGMTECWRANSSLFHSYNSLSAIFRNLWRPPDAHRPVPPCTCSAILPSTAPPIR